MLLSLALLACDSQAPVHGGRGHGDGAADVDPCEVPGNVCTWLGVPELAGFGEDGLPRTDPEHEQSTVAYLPIDLTFAPDGTAYYSDFNNHRIRAVGLDGLVTTVSGTGMIGDGPTPRDARSDCWEGCDALASSWNHPAGLALDPANPDQLLVAAWHTGRINVVDLDAGTMTWLAGTGARNYAAADEDLDGDFLDDCAFDLPSSVAFASDGSIYVSDQQNHLIRKIDREARTITDIAGEPRRAGMDGDGGPAALAHLHGLYSGNSLPGSKLAIDADDVLYVADTQNGVIRTVDLSTGVIDTFAGRESLGIGEVTDPATGATYEADLGSVRGYSGDGGPATEAVMNWPGDVAVGVDGELYIADTQNHCVRVVRDGIIDRFAGQCGESPLEDFRGDEGPALDATFGQIYGVAVGPEGDVYVADTSNMVIRRIRR